jgi:hypothetical protein
MPCLPPHTLYAALFDVALLDKCSGRPNLDNLSASYFKYHSNPRFPLHLRHVASGRPLRRPVDNKYSRSGLAFVTAHSGMLKLRARWLELFEYHLESRLGSTRKFWHLGARAQGSPTRLHSRQVPDNNGCAPRFVIKMRTRPYIFLFDALSGGSWPIP